MASRQIIFLFTLLFPLVSHAQNFAGIWNGTLTQDGKSEQYNYRIELEQHENRVSGTATSEKASGGTVAKFEIGGAWDGKILTLQEVKQLQPEGAKWCLKHIRLSLDAKGDLKGSWEAEGCKPGWIALKKEGGQPPVANVQPSAQEAETSVAYSYDLTPLESLPGHWVGYLRQSDRDYGFYFEMDLSADGTGTSRIISDEEGGNATHALKWTFDEKHNRLIFNESRVIEKSVETWPWCIKTAKLFYKKEENRLAMRGRWEGHIEGHQTDESGRCAPGKLFLERPLMQPEPVTQSSPEPIRATPEKEVKKYETQEERKVKVDRVLEVRSKRVRVAVWDNGTVDGDILSLFVNGDKILDNYRVSRRKHVEIVELNQSTNYLILHAINLGSITPNTVAVSVDDGIEEQVVIMSSNLAESGAVMLKEFRVGN